MGEGIHEILRHYLTEKTEYYRRHAAEPQAQIEDLTDGIPVALAPVLSAKDSRRSGA